MGHLLPHSRFWGVTLKRLLSAATLVLCAACSGGGSSTPTTPTNAARAALNIPSFSVTGSLSGAQYRYSIPIAVQNTGTVAATIASVTSRIDAPAATPLSVTFTGTEAFGTATLAGG